MEITIELFLTVIWWAGTLLLLSRAEAQRAYRRAQWAIQLGFMACVAALWFGALGSRVLSTYFCLYLLQLSLVCDRVRRSRKTTA